MSRPPPPDTGCWPATCPPPVGRPSRPPTSPPPWMPRPTSSRPWRPRWPCPRRGPPSARVAGPPTAPPASRRAGPSRSGPPRRPAAEGRLSRATAYLESSIGALDTRRDRLDRRAAVRAAAQVRRAAGDPPGRSPPRGAPWSSCPASRHPIGRPSWPPSPSCSWSAASSRESQRLANEAIRVARACDPVGREQEVHAIDDAGRGHGLGQGSGAGHRDAPRGRGGGARARGSRGGLPGVREPDHGARPGRPPQPRRSTSPSGASPRPATSGWTRRSATCSSATCPSRSSCSAAGTRPAT